MDDTVFRQAVIDAINALHEKPNAWLDSAVDAVMMLPSAQFATDINVGDKISRQEAIDVLTRKSTQLHGLHWGEHPEAPHIESGVLSSIEIIRELPSAQPQRRTGKWISEVKGKKAIIDEYGNVTCSAHCSECGDWLTASDEYACRGRYCPSCGADMRGEIDD